MQTKSSPQRGVAAIEFALVLALLLLMLSGLLVYWSLLQTQQSITRATGDGARVLQGLVNSGAACGEIEHQVEMVVQRGIKDAELANSADTEVDVEWDAKRATVKVSYPHPISDHLWSGLSVLRSLEAHAVVAQDRCTKES